MTSGRYDRYGLIGNPFRELASEGLEELDIFHVRLAVDDVLRGLEEEALEKENRALVAIVGPLGAGKTQRLRLAAAEAHARGAFTVYLDVPQTVTGAVQAVAKEIERVAREKGVVRTFSTPSWFKAVSALERAKTGAWEPVAAGKAIAAALNGTAPAFLLLNDLHNLTPAPEVPPMAHLLQSVADGLRPGTLVAFVCYANFLNGLARNFPAFASRINRTISLPGLSNDEARLLLAKKLLAKRIVEEIDPLFPFDRDAVAVVNEAAGGNPRQILEAAARVLEYATDHRSYRIDVPIARAALEATASPRAAPAASAPAAVPAEAARSPRGVAPPAAPRTPPKERIEFGS